MAGSFSGFLMSGDCKLLEIKDNLVIKVIDENKLPLHFRVNKNNLIGNSIDKWLFGRYINKNRKNFRMVYRALKLSSSDLENIINNKAFSLTDNYWLKSYDDFTIYEDLMNSSKKDIIADVALYGKYFNRTYNTITPELSNTGSYEKCWTFIVEDWYIKKNGGLLQAGNNIAETISCGLAKVIGVGCANYELADGGAYCISKSITKNKNLEPWGTVYTDKNSMDTNFILSKLKGVDKTMYLDIKYLDILILNMKRSSFDLALCTDKDTGNILGMAEAYDNNEAIFNVCLEDCIKELETAINDLKIRGVKYKLISEEDIRRIVNNECSKLDYIEYMILGKRIGIDNSSYNSIEDYIITKLIKTNSMLKTILES